MKPTVPPHPAFCPHPHGQLLRPDLGRLDLQVYVCPDCGAKRTELVLDPMHIRMDGKPLF